MSTRTEQLVAALREQFGERLLEVSIGAGAPSAMRRRASRSHSSNSAAARIRARNSQSHVSSRASSRIAV
jgi:hypothetical protein